MNAKSMGRSNSKRLKQNATQLKIASKETQEIRRDKSLSVSDPIRIKWTRVREQREKEADAKATGLGASINAVKKWRTREKKE